MNRVAMAAAAGILFVLAGLMEFVAAWAGHGSRGLQGVGVMFVLLGGLWFAIASRWRRPDSSN